MQMTSLLLLRLFEAPPVQIHLLGKKLFISFLLALLVFTSLTLPSLLMLVFACSPHFNSLIERSLTFSNSLHVLRKNGSSRKKSLRVIATLVSCPILLVLVRWWVVLILYAANMPPC